MKLTSAEANKMIRALKYQYRLLFSQEKNVVSFIYSLFEEKGEPLKGWLPLHFSRYLQYLAFLDSEVVS